MAFEMKNILNVRALTKSFGKLIAVSDVNLSLNQNEIRAVIGPNGAGKSTLFNLITGELKPDSGEVRFKGIDITGVSPYRIVHMGMARSFQVTNIYPKLTLFENVMVAVLVNQKRELDGFRFAKSIPEVNESTERALCLVGLQELSNVKGMALSHGDKKRLEIAMALASHPEILLLDEPTAGMSTEETDSTVQLIKRLSADLGITILFTEHDMRVVFSISDYISVLQQGKIIVEGFPDAVRNNRQVIEAYIGEKVV